MRTVALVAAVILVIVLGIGVLYVVRSQTPASTTLASPTPTTTATPTSAASMPTATTTLTPPPASPSPSPSGPATSAEQLADRLADALEQSDFERLRALIDPAGFFYQLYQTGGSQPITADQTIDRLKRGTTDGKLQVTVQRRPLLPRGQFQPDGDLYMVSTWMQYDNRPVQRVDLMLKNESGRWYWRGGLFGAPAQ